MSWAVALCLLTPQEELAYAELSKQLELGGADTLMRGGRYLEAAVAYRNALLLPGDREAVRVPFALALIGHGDLEYAGVEIWRARMLCEKFDRLVIRPEDLFTTRESFVDRVSALAQGDHRPYGWAALAYAWWIAGDRAAARKALEQYVRLRGADDFSRALQPWVEEKSPPPPAETKKEPAEDLGALEKQVEKIQPAPPKRAPAKPGSPRSAEIQFIRSSMEIMPERFER